MMYIILYAGIINRFYSILCAAVNDVCINCCVR